MARLRTPLIAIGGLVLAVLVYVPQVSTASWLYWDDLTTFWSHELPVMPTRILPALTMTWMPSPMAVQLTNVGLHIGVAGLVALWLARLGVSGPWAATAGVLLLLNPVAVETIRHGTGRADLLVGLGTVAACLAATARRWGWMVVGLAVAVTSKESGIVSLALVPLTLWIQSRPVSRTWMVWYGIGVGAAVSAVFAWEPLGQSMTDLVNKDVYAEQVTATVWLLTQATATMRLLATAVTGLGMTPDFDYDIVTPVWRELSLVSVGLLAVLAWGLRLSRPLIALGVAWIVVASLPRFVVQTPVSAYNEHQFYVALIGVIVALLGTVAPDRHTRVARC